MLPFLDPGGANYKVGRIAERTNHFELLRKAISQVRKDAGVSWHDLYKQEIRTIVWI
jgi:hypothetical protein